MSRKTLQDSATKLVGNEAPNPSYVEGYTTWRQAFEGGKAGIFTITVAEIIEVVEASINK